MMTTSSFLTSPLMTARQSSAGRLYYWIARFSLYCATKLLGTAKVARFTVPKIFLGAAKIARFSLYCATKFLGTAKLARFTVPKIFLGAAKIARFSLYCATKFLGTAKCAVPPCLGFCFASRVLLLKCLCQPMQELCAILVAPCIYKYSFFGKCSGSNISEKKSHAQHVASYIYYIYTSYLTRHLCVCHVWVERCSLLQLFFTETR